MATSHHRGLWPNGSDLTRCDAKSGMHACDHKISKARIELRLCSSTFDSTPNLMKGPLSMIVTKVTLILECADIAHANNSTRN